MTSEQRDILIEKMIDKPESLTNDEIALISSDTELKDLYKISSRLTDELIPIPEVDIDAEWSKMQSIIGERKSQNPFKLRWMWVAAVIVSVLMCGTIVIKYIISSSNNDSKADTTYVAKVTEPVNEPQSSKVKEYAELSPVKCQQKPVRTHVINPAKSDRHNDDIEEYIRIEQARVDNDVAMALAEVYREDYNIDLEELAEWLDSQSENVDSIIAPNINGININQLTML